MRLPRHRGGSWMATQFSKTPPRSRVSRSTTRTPTEAAPAETRSASTGQPRQGTVCPSEGLTRPFWKSAGSLTATTCCMSTPAVTPGPSSADIATWRGFPFWRITVLRLCGGRTAFPPLCGPSCRRCSRSPARRCAASPLTPGAGSPLIPRIPGTRRSWR